MYSEPAKAEAEKTTPLRRMVVEGDIFLCGILAATLTKFCLRADKSKQMVFKTLLVLCGFAKVAEVKGSSQKSAKVDSHERISLCCRMLLDDKTSDLLGETWTTKGKVRGVVVQANEHEEANGARSEALRMYNIRGMTHCHEQLLLSLCNSLRSSVAFAGDLFAAPGSDEGEGRPGFEGGGGGRRLPG